VTDPDHKAPDRPDEAPETSGGTATVPETAPTAPVDLDRLHEWITTGDVASFTGWFDIVDNADATRLLAQLSDEDRGKALQMVEPETARWLVGFMPESQALSAFADLEPGTAARILEELPSAEQADFIGELDPEQADAILARYEEAEDAEEVRQLAAYEDDEAGGIMVTEFLSFTQDKTVAEVLDDLAANAELYRGYDIQYAYVTDDDEHLVGVLPLRDMLLAGRRRTLRETMLKDPISLPVHMDLTDIAGLFREYPFMGLPVVDENRVLLGVVERAALEHALAEEADETYRSSQGIVGGEELRTMPLMLRARRRLSWLSANIVLNVIAASVIAMHEDTLQAVIALAVFLPIISDMSGCSGNQAVAVSMRELSLGVIRPTDALAVLRKELAVGLVNGSALGLLIGLVAWFYDGNPYLGLVVGSALAINTLVAVVIGGTVPLVLKRLGQDPAVAAGPLLTTVTDMCGFFLVLTLASFALAQLT
jgi:magnesium transporter